MSQATGVNTLSYDPSRCIGCGLCVDVCPHGVFVMPARSSATNGAARLIRPAACMECGACQLNCPAGAVTVDSGVGCAAAMISAALRGQDEPSCGAAEGGCSTEV